MNMNDCKICNGRGDYEKKGVLFECQCQIIKRIATSLPKYICKADVKLEHINNPIVNKIKSNLFIMGQWDDFRAIIKVTWFKFNKKFFRITSDAILKNAFVGNMSRRANGEEYEGETFNSVQDLVDAPDLVIFRLNELSYKNKAASACLEEALLHRYGNSKPSWVFSDVKRPFTSASHAYSKTVWEFLNDNFERVPISKTEVTEVATQPYAVSDVEPTQVTKRQEQVSYGDEEETEVKDPMSVFSSGNEKKFKGRVIKPSKDSDADSMLSVYSGGNSKPRFKKS